MFTVQSKRLIAICLLAFILVVAIFVPLAAAAAEEAAPPVSVAAPATTAPPAPTHDPAGTIAGNVKDVTAVVAVRRIRTGETGAAAV